MAIGDYSSKSTNNAVLAIEKLVVLFAKSVFFKTKYEFCGGVRVCVLAPSPLLRVTCFFLFLFFFRPYA